MNERPKTKNKTARQITAWLREYAKDYSDASDVYIREEILHIADLIEHEEGEGIHGAGGWPAQDPKK